VHVDLVDGEFVFTTGRQPGRELPAGVGAASAPSDAGDAAATA
jgi:hypothetical protein